MPPTTHRVRARFATSRPSSPQKRSFSRDELDAFIEGHAYSCFGAGFERAAAHTRTPSLPNGKLRLIDEIAEFDPNGGPWGRGYLRATAAVPKDMWFYDGHFKNDPCMPGTLMADAATQALSFAMAAYGFTIETRWLAIRAGARRYGALRLPRVR